MERNVGERETRYGIRALQAAFVLSGACGLVYEAVWAHYLKLFLGHAAYAQTVVLVVFIGGMAIGAAVCGRFADRVANPLRAYAAIECAIGVGGLVFHPLFVRATDWAYATLLPFACSGDGMCYAGWGMAAALVLPQSVLLGATFPLLVSGIIRVAGSDAGRHVSLLYFLNSLGAVAGVLLTTFVLIPWVGLPGTTLSAGIGNVLLAIAVWEIGGRIGRRSAVADLGHGHPAYDAPRAIRLLLAVSALTGLSSFLYEIFWIRMLSLVLGSSTHAFELMLASFILGLALGGWWIRARIDRIPDPWRFLGRVQVLMGLAAAATLPLYNHTFDFMALILRTLARTESGYVVYNATSAGIAMVVMLPATFLAGMTLPLLTLLLLRTRLGERSIGFVYAANTLGAIGGILLAVHLLMPAIGLRSGMLVAAAIDLALGVVLYLRADRTVKFPLTDRALPYVAALLFAGIGLGSSFDPLRLASGVFRHGASRLADGSEITFHADGKTATVDVIRSAEGTVVIRTNGKTDAAAYVPPRPGLVADEDTMVLAGLLPLAYRPEAERFAIIGFGSGMTTATVLDSSRVRQVDTIEIEPEMIEGARAFMPLVEAAYTDARSTFVIDDAKAHFARSGRKYDVIISEPSNPWVSGVASLFTKEFYRRVHGQLADRGLMVQWIQVYESNIDILASILKPLGDVFDDYVVFHVGGADLLILASVRGPVGEPTAAPFSQPRLAERLASIGIRNLADVMPRRIAGRTAVEQLISHNVTAPNSDYFPVVDEAAPQARFLNRVARELFDLADAPVPLVEMLERRPLVLDGVPHDGSRNERQVRSATAHQWAAYLQDAKQRDGKPIGRSTVLEESVAIARAILVDCAPPEVAVPLWDRVVLVAAELNPLLPRATAEALWTNLGARSCATALPVDQRRWLELFAATGARDPARMEALAAKLLQSAALSETQKIYLYASLVTAQLVERRYAAARETWQRVRTDVPAVGKRPSWMQLQEIWMQD